MGKALNRLLVKFGTVTYIVPHHKRVNEYGNIEDVDTYKVTRHYGTKQLGGGIDLPGRGGSRSMETTRAMMRTSPHFPARARRIQTGSSNPNGMTAVTPSLGRVRPDVETTDYFELPFVRELERRMGVDIHFSSTTDYANRRAEYFSRDGSLIDVPFDGLITTQRTVPGPEETTPTPLVVLTGGRYYLIHGHDQAVRDAESGRESTSALVVNLDRNDFRLDKEEWELPPEKRMNENWLLD